jgi:hypothetical protein
MTTIRLVLRQHRWPVAFIVVAALTITVGALIVWSTLAGLSTPANCIEDRFLDPIPPECVGTEEFLAANEDLAGKVMAFMFVLPLLAGVLLGAPLVGSELETRTATLAWSLGTSRRRWLLTRLAILGTGLAIVLAVPAIAANELVAARPRQYDMSTAVLVDYGLRGPLVVFRGLAAFSIGVAAGLVLGRVLPALLVAGVAILAIWLWAGNSQYAGWPEPEILVPEPNHYYEDRSDRDFGWVDAAGERITWEQVTARYPPGYDETDPDFDYGHFDAWMRANFRQVMLAIPGEKLAFVEWREAAGLAGFTLLLLGASVVAIEHRRPG